MHGPVFIEVPADCDNHLKKIDPLARKAHPFVVRGDNFVITRQALLALLAFFAASALGQAPSSSSPSMEQEIEDLRAENAAVREQLKTLVDTVNKLQRRLDGEPATVVREFPPPTPPPTQPLTATPPVAQSAISTPASKPAQTAPSQTPATVAALNTPPVVTQLASTSGQPESIPAPQTKDDRYRDGIVIWETSEDAKVPFLLKFNVNTQLRYLNTLDSDPTFTDHLGVTHDVHARNDITVNRAMFILGGYIFDKRALYSFTVWTSAGAASIVVAGNIGWRFSKAFTLTGRLQWRSRQPITGCHVPVFYGNRQEHG